MEVVYAHNAADQMFSGEVISRAVRGHLLVDAEMNTSLILSAFDVPLPSSERYKQKGHHTNKNNRHTSTQL